MDFFEMHLTTRLIWCLIDRNRLVSTESIGSVEPLSVTSIACGEYHSMALDGGGRLYTWGSNKYGQLGNV